MGILNKKISYFKSTKKTECVKGIDLTILDFLNRFKDGFYKDIVELVRGGDEEYKKSLPTIAFHGIFDGFRKKDLFIEATGIIILDIDDIEEDLEEVKEDIMASYDSVLSAFISPSGNGIKVLYYVTPELINTNNYKQIGKQLVSNFEVYGNVDYLSITDTLIATYDPNLEINEDAIPDFIYVKENNSEKYELEKRDENIPLWEDAEDFFDTVLAENIAEKTNNNFHYIQVAVLDLVKFGFKSDEHDLSFIIDYAESEFKRSSKNQGRLKEVCEIAKNYPQKKWAYKLIESDDPEDGYVDYTEYQDNNKEVEEDVSDDNFIDYSGFFERVIETINEGDRVGYEVSYKDLADIIRFKGSGVFTITGIPGHGKTEFLDAITLDLARLYGHQTLVAGYEQKPEEHVVKYMRKLEGKDIRCPSWKNNKENLARLKKIYNFVISKIIHLDTTKTGGNINTILEEFATKINDLREKGENPKYVVIDPFNMLSIKGKFSNHEKVEEIFRRITHFSHQMEVLVFLVAHPYKMKKDEKTGVYEVPDFYSVKGSSVFFEMSYHGAVVYRNGSIVMVKILKVKQNNLGTAGESAFFMYDRGSGRYIPCSEEGNEQEGTHRHKDWLEKALELGNSNYKS